MLVQFRFSPGVRSRCPLSCGEDGASGPRAALAHLCGRERAELCPAAPRCLSLLRAAGAVGDVQPSGWVQVEVSVCVPQLPFGLFFSLFCVFLFFFSIFFLIFVEIFLLFLPLPPLLHVKVSPGVSFPLFRRCTFREGERKVHQPDAFPNVSPSPSTACRTPERSLFPRWRWRLPGWQTASKQTQTSLFLTFTTWRFSWLKGPSRQSLHRDANYSPTLHHKSTTNRGRFKEIGARATDLHGC